MASTYLTRSLASTNTSWTFSAWVKRSGITATNYLISWGNSGTDATGIGFNADDTFQYYSESSPDNKNRKTSAVYRDTNAWYHLVCKCDANAITLYVNGEEPTQSWITGSSANPLDTSTMAIGKWVTSAYYHDGSMSHVHFIDGTAYNATAFGEYDANGVWKIKTSPSVTYGTNGFFILKDGNSVTDQSGEGNNLTVGGGTLTKTEDSPSNVFATINPLDARPDRINTFSNGNTTYSTNAMGRSSLAVTSGKWYAETKYTANEAFNGVSSMVPYLNNNTRYVALYGENNGEIYVDGSATDNNVGAGTAIADGSIIMIAMDLDNNRIYYGKNGLWWTSGSGFVSSTLDSYKSLTRDVGEFYGFMSASGSGTCATSWNFGNGYFGTTAVSSAGTNASGIGIFEYDVPTDYTALSTKGLNL